MLRGVWPVIRREYVQRVHSKWFVLATLGGPIFLVATLAVPLWFGGGGGGDGLRGLAIVDGTDVLYERVAPALAAGGFRVEEVRWTSTVVDTLRRRADAGDIAAFLLLDQFTLESGDAVLYTRTPPSPLQAATLRSAVVRAALEIQLEQRGVDVEAMLAEAGLDVQLLAGAPVPPDEVRFMVAYIGAFLLYVVILLYAVSVMRATLEEKTSRIVEIVISAMKPWHLMLGKILGVGAVGLTQMSVWVLTTTLIIYSGLPAMLAPGGAGRGAPGGAGAAESAGSGAAGVGTSEAMGLEALLPGPDLLALFLGFFVFGYFIYSGLYAAVGAMCSTDDEAQQAQLPLIMFLVVPIIFVAHVIENPSAPLSVGLSLFPLFTPILMWARVAGGGVPAWEITLSFGLMLLAILGVAWLAGRIYKAGILMTGKRPSLGELWRWVREA